MRSIWAFAFCQLVRSLLYYISVEALNETLHRAGNLCRLEVETTITDAAPGGFS